MTFDPKLSSVRVYTS